MPIIYISDLPAALQAHELIEAMVAGANARAARVAPCLVNETTPASEDQLAEARLVLMGALQRWVEAGSGAFQQQTAGPFSTSVDTRQRTGFNLWPSEIETLQSLCSDGTTASSGAFSIIPSQSSTLHLPWCSLYFGAAYCSCGVDIAGYPIFEGGALAGDAY